MRKDIPVYSKRTGIYTITNLINGKMYVGYASNIRKRSEEHKVLLVAGKHPNDRLQKSYKRHGGDNFLFEILVECEKEHLASEEHYWCNLLLVHNDKYGYNIAPTNPYGKVGMSEESRRKLSTALKGKSHSKEWCENISKACKGRAIYPETMEKFRLSNLNKIMTDEIKAKISKALTGRVFTQETLEKISKNGQKRAAINIECEVCHQVVNSVTYGMKHGKQCGKEVRLTDAQREKISKSRKGKIQAGVEKAIIQMDKDENIIAEYKSVNVAALATNISRDTIRRYANEYTQEKNNRNMKTPYKWKWKHG